VHQVEDLGDQAWRSADRGFRPHGVRGPVEVDNPRACLGRDDDDSPTLPYLAITNRHDGTAACAQAARSVVKVPELLSRTYRNRVRELSPGNRNSGVQHLPGPHTSMASYCCTKINEGRSQDRNRPLSWVEPRGFEPLTSWLQNTVRWAGTVPDVAFVLST